VQFLDDWTVSGVVVVNAVDGTGIVVPDVAVKLGDRWAVHAGAQVPFGEEGEFVPPKENFDVTFGANTTNLAGFVPAAIVDTWVRYSF
jgi:hypothetical protein